MDMFLLLFLGYHLAGFERLVISRNYSEVNRIFSLRLTSTRDREIVVVESQVVNSTHPQSEVMG